MKKPIVALMALFALTASASASDVYRHHRYDHVRSAVRAYEAPLPPFQAPDPLLFAGPGFTITVKPWLTQSANPLTDPAEFGTQFVPRVHFGPF